jgi:hypothetical protein
MQRHAFDAADACRTLEHNARLVASGRISADAAARGNAIARALKDHATLAYERARSRYERAQRCLEANPLPGDVR